MIIAAKYIPAFEHQDLNCIETKETKFDINLSWFSQLVQFFSLVSMGPWQAGALVHCTPSKRLATGLYIFHIGVAS